jgi:hypothetical protein
MPIFPNIRLEAELVHALEDALTQLPGVKLSRLRGSTQRNSDDGADAVLQIKVQGRTIRVLVQAKQSAFPRDIRHHARLLGDIANKRRGIETVPIIVAPSISPGSRDLLREHGIGYFDAGGSLYLPLSSGVYFIERQPPRGQDRQLRNLYKGRTTQVLHLLLAKPERKWHVNELADEAKVSPYTVHQVFTALEKQLWIEKEGKGPESVRTLRQPGALLDAWAENYSAERYEFRNYHRWAQSFDSLRQAVAEKVEEHGGEYALTLASGAQLVAPFATSVDRLHLIVSATTKIDVVAKNAGLKPADDGANVTFMVTREYTPLLLRRQLQGVWVASDVQLYLDLWNWPARGKEQAEYLRKERLHY